MKNLADILGCVVLSSVLATCAIALPFREQQQTSGLSNLIHDIKGLITGEDKLDALKNKISPVLRNALRSELIASKAKNDDVSLLFPDEPTADVEVNKRQGAWDFDYGLGGGRFGKRSFEDYGYGGGRFGRSVDHVEAESQS